MSSRMPFVTLVGLLVGTCLPIAAQAQGVPQASIFGVGQFADGSTLLLQHDAAVLIPPDLASGPEVIRFTCTEETFRATESVGPTLPRAPSGFYASGRTLNGAERFVHVAVPPSPCVPLPGLPGLPLPGLPALPPSPCVPSQLVSIANEGGVSTVAALDPSLCGASEVEMQPVVGGFILLPQVALP